MQSINTAYPVRMFIRHKARHKLAEALQLTQAEPTFDAPLFWDVTNTLLQPSTSPNLYRPYPSRDQAAQVEEHTADAIASAYLRIKQQASDPLVQDLNKLL
ncbi:MAG TPA: hypothetical protein V6D29_02630 [Leptolyngbyaceae cyanobacterium]